MDHFYKDILRFQIDVKQCIDDRNSPIARKLTDEVQRLEDAVQVKKNPNSIEDIVKRVQSILEEAGHHEVMSHNDVHSLEHRCEHFVQELRKM